MLFTCELSPGIRVDPHHVPEKEHVVRGVSNLEHNINSNS